jgi:hypothetical protein
VLLPVCLAPSRKTTGVSASAASKKGVIWRGIMDIVYNMPGRKSTTMWTKIVHHVDDFQGLPAAGEEARLGLQ